jgi:hypothetical protein
LISLSLPFHGLSLCLGTYEIRDAESSSGSQCYKTTINLSAQLCTVYILIQLWSIFNQ